MRLYLLELGLSPDGTPMPGYLIETDGGRRSLVDSGMSRATIGTEPFPGFHVVPEWMVDARLAELGLRPDDIDTLVCTHFDFDHAGGHGLFTRAELVAQRRQYEAATSGATTRYDATRDQWGRPGLRYRLVDGDTQLDAGVELIDTSGHTPGHQSVLVRLPNTGPVLLTIDAATSTAQLDPATYTPNPFDADPAEALASLERLRRIIAEQRVALTICGHDARQWATLRRAPQYYD